MFATCALGLVVTMANKGTYLVATLWRNEMAGSVLLLVMHAIDHPRSNPNRSKMMETRFYERKGVVPIEQDSTLSRSLEYSYSCPSSGDCASMVWRKSSLLALVNVAAIIPFKLSSTCFERGGDLWVPITVHFTLLMSDRQPLDIPRPFCLQDPWGTAPRVTQLLWRHHPSVMVTSSHSIHNCRAPSPP